LKIAEAKPGKTNPFSAIYRTASISHRCDLSFGYLFSFKVEIALHTAKKNRKMPLSNRSMMSYFLIMHLK